VTVDGQGRRPNLRGDANLAAKGALTFAFRPAVDVHGEEIGAANQPFVHIVTGLAVRDEDAV
jgi:hypothetical protein